MISAFNNEVNKHPQLVMRELGIAYLYSVPQSMGDCWEFWCCENTPNELPSYLKEADWNPYNRIGWGLSEEMAKEIYRRINEQN
jgi:hypothetical protein